MSEKGLSNNPKVRVKVAKKYNVEMQSKKIQGEIHSRSTVDRGYRYSYERVYPKRIDQFNKSYQSGKAVYNSPNKPNTKISMNTGKNYAETANRLNKVNKDIANFGRRHGRLEPAFQKDIMTKKLKTAKTMGNLVKGLRNITVPGIIAKVMQPKKVGDATLHKGEYRKVK
jgi:vacuolar-type H+-ATPase subunit I/STV1